MTVNFPKFCKNFSQSWKIQNFVSIFLMLDILVFIINSILIVLAVSLFSRFYGLKICKNLYDSSTIVITIISVLLGTSFSSYEISSNYHMSKSIDSNDLQLIEKILYNAILINSFLISPIITEYKHITEKKENTQLQPLNQVDEEITFNLNLKKTISNQMSYYCIVLGIINLSFCFSFLFEKQFTLSNCFSNLSLCANTYGLFLYAYSTGYGFICFWMRLLNNTYPINQLRKYLIFYGEVGNDNEEDEPSNYLFSKCDEYYEKFTLQIYANDRHLAIKMKIKQILIFIFGSFMVCFWFVFEFAGLEQVSIFQKILSRTKSNAINQIISFVWISLITFISSYELTYINNKSLYAKIFHLEDYKFIPKKTSSSTFGHWSMYIQRLAPSIAYRWQLFSGAKNTTILNILAAKNTFFKEIFNMALWMIFTVIVCAIFFFATDDTKLDEQGIQKGLTKYKNKGNVRNNRFLDYYIVHNRLIPF